MRTTHRAVPLVPFLHLDKTPHAEEMSTAQPNGLERNRSADQAGVVVKMGYDRYQSFADSLHEHPW
jgi:hypothetical protein